ncbi:uncharacterized protein LOC144448123 [Glandiceps talaboti]
MSTTPMTEPPMSTTPVTEPPVSTTVMTEPPMSTTVMTESPMTTTPMTEQPMSTTPMTEPPVSTTVMTESPMSTTPMTEPPMSTTPMTEPPMSTTPMTEPPMSTTPMTEPPMSTTPMTEPPMSTTPMTEPPMSTTPMTEPPMSTTPMTESPMSTTPMTESPMSTTPMTEPPISTTPMTEPPMSTTPMTEPPMSTTPMTEPPMSTAPMTMSPMSTTPMTEPPMSTTPMTEPPMSTTPMTEPPMSTTPMTEPPMSTTPMTEPPMSTTPMTEPPMSTTPMTEPPMSTTPMTESPMSTTPMTEPPISTTPMTEPPISTTPMTESPISTTPMTEPPMSTTPMTEPPMSTTPMTESPTSTTPMTEPPMSTTPMTELPMSTTPMTELPMSTTPMTILPVSTMTSSPTFATPTTISPMTSTAAPETPTSTLTESPASTTPMTASPTSLTPTTESSMSPTMKLPTSTTQITEGPTSIITITASPTSTISTTEPSSPTVSLTPTAVSTTKSPTSTTPITESPTSTSPTMEPPMSTSPSTESPTTTTSITESPTSIVPTTVLPTSTTPTRIVPTPESSTPTTESQTTPNATEQPEPDDSHKLAMSLKVVGTVNNDTWRQVEEDLADLYITGNDNLNTDDGRRKKRSVALLDTDDREKPKHDYYLLSDGERQSKHNDDLRGNVTIVTDKIDIEMDNVKNQTEDYQKEYYFSTARKIFNVLNSFRNVSSVKDYLYKHIGSFQKSLTKLTDNDVRNGNTYRVVREADDDVVVKITDQKNLGDDEYAISFYITENGQLVPAEEAAAAYDTMTTQYMSAVLGHEVTTTPTPITYIPDENGDDNLLWILLGVGIGVVLLIIIIVIIYYCCKKGYCRSDSEIGEEDVNKKSRQKSKMQQKTTTIDMAGLRIDIERGEIVGRPSTNLSKVQSQNGQIQETVLDNDTLEQETPRGRKTDKFDLISVTSDADTLSIKPRRLEDIPPDRRPKLVGSYESLLSAVSMEPEEPGRDNSLFTHVGHLRTIDENATSSQRKPGKEMQDLANLPPVTQTALVGKVEESVQIKMMREAGVPQNWYKTKKELEVEDLQTEIDKWKKRKRQKEKLRKERERKRRQRERDRKPSDEHDVERDAWLAAQPEIDAIIGDDVSPAARQMREARSERWKKHPHKGDMPSTAIPNGDVKFNVKKMGRNMRAKSNQVATDYPTTDSNNVQLVNVQPLGSFGRHYLDDPHALTTEFGAMPPQPGYAWIPQSTDLNVSQQPLPQQQYLQQEQYPQQQIPLQTYQQPLLQQQLPPQMQQQMFQPVDTHPLYQEQSELQRLHDEMEIQRRREQERVQINRLLDDAFSLTTNPLMSSSEFSPTSGLGTSPPTSGLTYQNPRYGSASGLILDPGSLDRNPRNPAFIPGSVTTGSVYPDQMGSLPRSSSAVPGSRQEMTGTLQQQMGMPVSDIGYGTRVQSAPYQPYGSLSQSAQYPSLNRQPLVQPQPQYGTIQSGQDMADKAKLTRENDALSEQLRLQQLHLEQTLRELGQAQSRLDNIRAPPSNSARSTPLSPTGRPQRKISPSPYPNRPEELPGPALGWSSQDNTALPSQRTHVHDSWKQDPHSSSQRGDNLYMDSSSDQPATARSRSSSSGREPHLTSVSIPGVSATDSLTQEQRQAILQEMKNGTQSEV